MGTARNLAVVHGQRANAHANAEDQAGERRDGCGRAGAVRQPRAHVKLRQQPLRRLRPKRRRIVDNLGPTRYTRTCQRTHPTTRTGQLTRAGATRAAGKGWGNAGS